MNFDVVIIGGGPAGLTAGIYAVRAGLSVAIVEKQFAGGQIANTESVENYPGLLGISGFDLSMKMLEQAESLGVKMIYDSVVGTKLLDKEKVVLTALSGEIVAKTVILCAGAAPRKLGIASEEKFISRGVSYCAVCDGAFYKNKSVVVVGGGNTAVGDSLYLAKFAKEVHLVHRRDKLRATKADIDKIINAGVQIHYNTIVEEIVGEDKVTSVSVKDTTNGSISQIAVDGVFVAIGHIPNGSDIANEVARDEYGYFVADEDMKTNVEGVFVAGDVRQKKVRQVITACSDGAIAAEMANEYILTNFD